MIESSYNTFISQTNNLSKSEYFKTIFWVSIEEYISFRAPLHTSYQLDIYTLEHIITSLPLQYALRNNNQYKTQNKQNQQNQPNQDINLASLSPFQHVQLDEHVENMPIQTSHNTS